MQPGEQIVKYFRVLDSAGAAVTTLSESDFTFLAYTTPFGGSTATWTHGSTVTHLASGLYAWKYTAPSSAGQWGITCVPNTSTYAIEFAAVTGETESQDLDTVYANVANFQGTLSSSGVLGDPIALEAIVYRKRAISITVRDSAGALVDLSGYTNWRLAIRDRTQAALEWVGTNDSPKFFTISGNASGVISITLPESLVGPQWTAWTASRVFRKGDFVVPVAHNGWVYQCTTAGTSGGSEPAWPTTEGNTVADNTVTWTTLKKTVWTATTAKALDDWIVGTASASANPFRCTRAGTTAGSEPTWSSAPNPGDTITDGTVIWQRQSDPYAYLDAGETATDDVFYEIAADESGDTSKTVAVVGSSPLTLKRREDGA